MASYEVVHHEMSRGRSRCGVRLTEKHQSTDDVGILEEREGTRCARCWRSIEAGARHGDSK